MLGKLTREHKTDGSLNLTGGKGCLLVVSSKLSGLGGNTPEDIVDEGVHDRHSLLGDTGIWVDLLEDLVDVRRVGFGTLLGSLACCGLLWCLSRLLGWSLGHCCGLENAFEELIKLIL